MERDNNRVPQVTISQNEMEAYLMLPRIPADQNYSVTEIVDALTAKKVCSGIIQEELTRMLVERVYGKEVLIARGTKEEDGVDGYYDFQFNTDFNNKPQIRVDGSVDYWNIHAVEIVQEGQVIALYHEPTPGKSGMTVTGKTRVAKRGRPQPPLTGRGFERSADNKVYTATMSGKIERQGNRIQIAPVYEKYGNVDIHTGNIDFRGDVIIHGNVNSGAVIKATGSVTIDGTAEACQIEAGKDIVLRGGVLGANKGLIRCQGNVFARFIEYATIECEGFLEAESSLCSSIVCYDKIYMNGRNANIIGGNVYGVCGIEASSIGNEKEVKTDVQVGVNKQLMTAYLKAENRLRAENDIVAKINSGLAQFDELAQEHKIDVNNDERRVALLRARIMKQAEVAKAKEEHEHYRSIIEKAKGSTVKVNHNVYSGVTVSINTASVRVKEEQSQVEFVERNGRIVMTAVREEMVI